MSERMCVFVDFVKSSLTTNGNGTFYHRKQWHFERTEPESRQQQQLQQTLTTIKGKRNCRRRKNNHIFICLQHQNEICDLLLLQHSVLNFRTSLHLYAWIQRTCSLRDSQSVICSKGKNASKVKISCRFKVCCCRPNLCYFFFLTKKGNLTFFRWIRIQF